MSDIPYTDVIQAARDAGAAILNIYEQDFEVYEKGDSSPLTEADLSAHRVIEAALTQLTPGLPVLSEESENAPWDERQHWQRYWLVDPLDGTKEFVKKNGEFTVNIALIDRGEPAWGVVYAPVPGMLYHGGPATGGSWKEDEQGQSHAIHVRPPPSGKTGWRIMGSRSHYSPAFKAFIDDFEQPVIKNVGSSLKICLVAEGDADLYPRMGPTCEWDTGAAHAVLLGAGGRLEEAGSGEPLRYNQNESVLNPYFIARAR